MKKRESRQNVDVATIILAGGQGTRLSPLTETRCKPDVLFAGRYRLIDIPISASINSGFHRIYVISQYLASHLNKHIKDTFQLSHHSKIDLSILSPEETKTHTWYNGTADAVRKNIKHLLEDPAEYYLILSGDHLYSMDLQDLIHFAVTSRADLTIASIPVDKSQAKRMGLLQITEERKITHFVEKPQEEAILQNFQLPQKFSKDCFFPYTEGNCYLASMGIYVFKRETLLELLEEQDGDDFGHNIIPHFINQGGKAASYIYKGYWEDIGTVTSYYMASMAFLKGEIGLNFYDERAPVYSQIVNLPCPKIEGATMYQSIICDGSIIKAEEIVHSIIGMRVHILEGTTLKECIIMGNPHSDLLETYTIGRNCHLEKVIVDEGAHIGNNVTLINKDHVDHFESNLIAIKEGIIIVKAGSKIPDNYTMDYLAA